MPTFMTIDNVLRIHERNVRKVKHITKELNEDFGVMISQFAEEHSISQTEIIDLMLTLLRDVHFTEIRRSAIDTYMKGR